jgi:hypothetical protein
MSNARIVHALDQQSQLIPTFGWQFLPLQALRHHLGIIEESSDQRCPVPWAGSTGTGGNRFRHRQTSGTSTPQNLPFLPGSRSRQSKPDVLIAKQLASCTATVVTPQNHSTTRQFNQATTASTADGGLETRLLAPVVRIKMLIQELPAETLLTTDMAF